MTQQAVAEARTESEQRVAVSKPFASHPSVHRNENAPKARRPGRPSRAWQRLVADGAGAWEERVVLTEAQRALVAENIGLVGVHLRHRVPTPLRPTRRREYADLFQEGCVALARAAASYDPEKDAPFASYALPRIRGRIHAALYEYFATVRVPTYKLKHSGRRRRAGQGPGVQILRERRRLVWGSLRAEEPRNACEETIRHVIRRRFERAILLALADLRQRMWRQRDPTAIMERIAAERLLISQEANRTPVRRIAGDVGVSSSRVCEYESLLMRTVHTYFAKDVQVRLLLRWAARDVQGFDAPVDARRQMVLRRVDSHRFMARFRQLKGDQKAKVVFALVKNPADALEEVVCNLYRLRGEGDMGTFLCVA